MDNIDDGENDYQRKMKSLQAEMEAIRAKVDHCIEGGGRARVVRRCSGEEHEEVHSG